jgi:hydroxymethylbilane synthase
MAESLTIRIATRASALATWQAEHVAARLRALPEVSAVELVPVTTQGDRDRNSALSTFGGVGVFTREVQQAVLDGRADLAVHSLKDLPTEQAAGLTIGAVLDRAPRCDALLLPHGRRCGSLDELPHNARVGTGSLRRQAQLLSRRRDLQLGEIRGNLDTRLRKLDEGEFDAIILAEAGLRRLGWDERISLLLAPPVMYPAVGQGAIGVECRHDDDVTLDALKHLDDAVTRIEVTAERACLGALRAGCHAPVGAWSKVEERDGVVTLVFEAVVWSRDGSQSVRGVVSGPGNTAVDIGQAAARQILEQGGQEMLGSGG